MVGANLTRRGFVRTVSGAAAVVPLSTVQLLASERIDVAALPGGLCEGLTLNRPIYIPRGRYRLDSTLWKHVCDNDVDAVGDGPETQIEFRGWPLIGGKGFVKFANLAVHGTGMTHMLNCNESTGEVPGFKAERVTSRGVGMVFCGKTDDPGYGIGFIGLEDVRIDGARRPCQYNRAVRTYEIVRTEILNANRFALCLGPTRKGAQARMVSGKIEKLVCRHVKPKVGSNSSIVWLAGQNVEMYDCELADLPNVPQGKATDGNGKEWWSDIEGLYTKVIHLRVNRIRLIDAGGNQAFLCPKGRHPDGSGVVGLDSVFDDVEMICDPAVHPGPATAVWHQTHGPTVLANFQLTNMSGVALRMHKSVRSDVIVEGWNVKNQRGTSPLILANGVGTCRVSNSVIPDRGAAPSLYRHQHAKQAGMIVTEDGSNRYY